ncbi:MAG: ferredoxin/flavodoxin---NADP+ reductase, partial [Alphaproteobacteria bacterium]|nr:ferredoxin/flavodoxin---NADP+ reductase [Alphaproteobacteria bacterium]
MSLSVAIVGSGPGGMYVAQALLEKVPGVKIDVIERLPSPFGLIRGGVAPDHATTKNVARAFEKTLQKPGVRYLGNIEVGKTV